MGFWKVLGGAAAGVACVVAAPIAGPVGAITAVGAAVAAGTGAAAGAVAEYYDNSEESAKAEGRRQGEEKAAAKYDKKYQKLVDEFERVDSKLTEAEEHYNLIIGMSAVGLACANCDGEISPLEKAEIDEFIGGISSLALPDAIKTKIEKMAETPPSLATAFKLAQSVSEKVGFDIYEEIIEVVMHADGVVHENETQFKDDWMTLKALA